MSSSHLPQEIDEEILGYLRDDKDALQACSLSCRTFLATCQKYLFSKIVLSPPTDKNKRPNGLQFQRLLTASPHLSKYIHHLEIIDHKPEEKEWLSQDATLIFCLPFLRWLKALVILYRTTRQGGNWEGIARGGLLASFLDVMQLPSMTYLHFEHLPLPLIKHCPSHLKHLALEEPTTDVTTGLNELVQRVKTIQLESLRIRTIDRGPTTATSSDWFTQVVENTGFDVTKLKRLHAEVDGGMEELAEIWTLLKLCAGTLLELTFSPCTESMSSMSADDWGCIGFVFISPFLVVDDPNVFDIVPIDPIDWSILRALRIFNVQLDVLNASDDSGDNIFLNAFPWFIGMLQKLSSSGSTIEEFAVEVHYTFDGMDIDLSPWTEVMDLFSDQKRFPALRILYIHIYAAEKEIHEIMRQGEEHVNRLDLARSAVICQLSNTTIWMY
ncbi:hypothetical protein BDZ97DRAFT_1794698 [Flammula alnicola]|nr:hypothetical protein BDZ97DRAFT_1794698 [Flammula alnicola]